jgi:hypothetical protein
MQQLGRTALREVKARLQLEDRHCEERKRRSNPRFLSFRGEMDCFASLAMTIVLLDQLFQN